MPQIRRSVYVFFHRYDAPILAPEQLLRADVQLRRVPQLLAISILRGEEFAIEDEDFELLSRVPSDTWIDDGELAEPERSRARRLAERGLLVSTDDDPLLRELRAMDERLARGQWNIYAALHHSLTRWRDVDVSRRFDDQAELPVPPPGAADAFVEQYGRPPPAFHGKDRPDAIPLPVARPTDGLFGALRRRKTTRVFDAATPVTTDEVAVVLDSVFGCHGVAEIARGVPALKKTSPSGGSLHPIEAYVLVRNVAGVDPGLYHYRIEDHALTPIETLEASEAERLAGDFTAGQTYFAGAAVLVVLAARFHRSFWKYRKHERAYGVVLLDAGHLSQTLYLVCAELGLGAFVTAAINGANIDERLGLDGFDEGAIAVCGFGRPVAGGSPLEPEFVPYVPRESTI